MAAVVTLLSSVVSYHGITGDFFWSATGAGLVGGSGHDTSGVPQSTTSAVLGDTVGVREQRPAGPGSRSPAVRAARRVGIGTGNRRYPCCRWSRSPMVCAGSTFTLDGTDIVGAGGRLMLRASACRSEERGWNPKNEPVIAPSPASAPHPLVLRMNPRENGWWRRDLVGVDAGGSHRAVGPGSDGQSCAARPVTTDELTEVDSAVLADWEPTRSPRLASPSISMVMRPVFGYAVVMITSETFDELFAR